jgi:hypothetical protein
MFKIEWNQQERIASSIDDVNRILDELHMNFMSGDPQLVTVELNETGDSLAIGLGRDRSVLNYINGSKDPPYLTSTGGIEVDEPIAFRFGGEWSEFPMKNSIPTSVARQVMGQFCATGNLSSAIQWEED